MSLTALNNRLCSAILFPFIAVPIPFAVYFQLHITTPTPFLVSKTTAQFLYDCHPQSECLSHLLLLHTMNLLLHAQLHKKLPTATPTLLTDLPRLPHSLLTPHHKQPAPIHWLLHTGDLTSLCSVRFIPFHLPRLTHTVNLPHFPSCCFKTCYSCNQDDITNHYQSSYRSYLSPKGKTRNQMIFQMIKWVGRAL